MLAPALRFDSPRFSVAGQGSLTAFESGNAVLQGSAALAWLARSRGSSRLELFGSVGASRYATEPGTGHLVAGARVHVFKSTDGVWIGANAVSSFGGLTGVPVELVAAGWSVRNRFAAVGTMTATLHRAVRHLDLSGAFRWSGRLLELEARVGARLLARGSESGGFTGGYGELSVVVPLTQRLSVAASGGSYPPDPARRTLGAEYLSAGVRLRALGPSTRSVPVHTMGVWRGRLVPTSESGPRLTIEGSGELRRLRVRAPGASSIELMGDFTDWVAVPLRQVSPGVWEIELPLPPGVHRVNVRIDGGPWSVPGGARLERTEFGGTVGIIVIP